MANLKPHTYADPRPFRVWCQQVIPLVYDDSLSYAELLYKMLHYLNTMMEQLSEMGEDITELYKAYNEFTTYVETYLQNLDVQDEIDNKLDEMVRDGTLSNIIRPLILNTLPPMLVDSTMDMTDINRIYVLKGNSHIYQYIEGSGFVDTGIVYGQTIGNVETYLGRLAYGNDFNDVAVNSSYYLSSQMNAGYINFPPFANTGMNGVLKTWGDGEYRIQVIEFVNGTNVTRLFADDSWGQWMSINSFYDSLANGTDLNNVDNNTAYYLYAQSNANYLNYPIFVNNNLNGLLVTTGSNYNKIQKLDLDNGTSVIRLFVNNEWRPWMSNSNFFSTLRIGSDLNEVQINSSFYMYTQATGNYLNFPAQVTASLNGLLQTFGDNNYSYQTITFNDGTVLARYKAGGTWRPWLSQNLFYTTTDTAPYNAYAAYVKSFGNWKTKYFSVVNSIISSYSGNDYFHKTTRMPTESFFSFLDDDTSTQAYVNQYHDVCVNKGILGNYAVITNNVTNEMLSDLKAYELQGFNMLYHCQSQIDDYRQRERTPAIMTNFVEGLRRYNEFGFLNSKLWVIPYGNNARPIVELSYMYGLEGGFTTGNLVPVFPQQSPYTMPRISVGASSRGGTYRSFEEIKALIDSYYARRTWFVFTTHVNAWETTGESQALMEQVIDYCKSLNITNVNISEGFNLFKNYMNGIF